MLTFWGLALGSREFEDNTKSIYIALFVCVFFLITATLIQINSPIF